MKVGKGNLDFVLLCLAMVQKEEYRLSLTYEQNSFLKFVSLDVLKFKLLSTVQ